MNEIAPTQKGLKKASTGEVIPSLLVPISNKSIMLPTVSVAEMLPYRTPEQLIPMEGKPAWFLGSVSWRGVMIPMISYEGISGHEMPNIKAVSQMVVLNSTGVHSKLPFLCFPTQGIPRLSRVLPDNIIEDTSQTCDTYDEMAVLVNDVAATIPNVAQLEQALVTLLAL